MKQQGLNYRWDVLCRCFEVCVEKSMKCLSRLVSFTRSDVIEYIWGLAACSGSGSDPLCLINTFIQMSCLQFVTQIICDTNRFFCPWSKCGNHLIKVWELFVYCLHIIAFQVCSEMWPWHLFFPLSIAVPGLWSVLVSVAELFFF